MVCVSERATTLYTVHGILARKPAVQWGHRVPGVVFFFGGVDPTDRWAPGPGRLIKLTLAAGLDLGGVCEKQHDDVPSRRTVYTCTFYFHFFVVASHGLATSKD